MSLFRILPDRIDVVQSQNRPDDKNSWQYKLYVIIFQANTKAGKMFDIILSLMILINIFIILAESIESLSAKYSFYFRQADRFFLFVFTLEYLLRLSCVKVKKRFVKSTFGMLDLIAILPSYFEYFLPQSHMLMIIRSFRLLRVFRIFGMVKFLDESRELVFALIRSFRKIAIFLFFILILAFLLGSLMYLAEYQHNPNFHSIPQSIYWAIVTLTTVGYGDITPITPIGKILASFIMILGYSIIAVPTGIIGGNIIKEMKKTNINLVCENCGTKEHSNDAVYCQQCGERLHQPVI
ncbi:MAG: ion transporter [Saprospiraceae bacterium]|nr:MAG: ion transporter [Candidatus Parvibacillus calidus]MCC7149102.1 ion transporter [Saprospiraceae bacterium]WKZ61736.1 MAG: ion transporter [Saprospiraceae bacterium]